MHERPVCRIHQSDDAVVHIAGQLRSQMRTTVTAAEFGQFRDWWQRVPDFHPHPAAARLGYVDPGVSIALAAGKRGRVDAARIGVLAGQGRNLHALAGFRLEDPSVVFAGDCAAIEPSAGERDAAMGAAVAHGENAAVLFASQNQWDPQQHCGGHLPSPEHAATHGGIPVVIDEGCVRPQQIAHRKNRRSSSRCCVRCHGLIKPALTIAPRHSP